MRLLAELTTFLSLDLVSLLCRLVVNYEELVTKEHALLNRIKNVTTEEEMATLAGKSPLRQCGCRETAGALHMGDFTQPQQKYAGTGENCNIAIPVFFYPVIKSL